MDTRQYYPLWRRNAEFDGRMWRNDQVPVCQAYRFTGYAGDIRAITEHVMATRSTFSTEELQGVLYGTRPLPSLPSTQNSNFMYQSIDPSKLNRLPDPSLRLNLPPSSTASSFYPGIEAPHTSGSNDMGGRSNTEKYLLAFVLFLALVVILLVILLFLVLFDVVKKP